MSSSTQALFLSATTQLLFTVCMVTMLWALYTQLQRYEFFRWWAWAWTAFAVFLLGGTLSLHLGPVWTAQKFGLVLLLVVAGYLQPVLLVFGGLTWHSTAQVSRRWFWAGIALAGTTAILCFTAGFVVRHTPMLSFSIRNAPRSLLLTSALLFCCVAFWREFRRSGSRAAIITGIFCFSYAINQFCYFLSFCDMLVPFWGMHLPSPLHSLAQLDYLNGLLFLDLIDTCGICLGMILLLVERYKDTAAELELSEQKRLGLAVNNVSLQAEIRQRQKVEEELRESERTLRLVADTVTSAIWLFQDGRLVYFNKEFERITGYSREEILAMDPWDLFEPEFRAGQRVRAEARLAGEAVPSRYEFAILTKRGEKRWLDFSAALTEFHGKPAILASALDITAARRAERELKEHAMYMDALILNVPLGIVIKDEQQHVRFCNPAFEHMFQYSQAEIQGKNLDDLIAPHDWQEARQLSDAVQDGGVVHTTARRRRKDGSLIDVELYGVKVFSGKSFLGAFAIYQDISERRKSEEKLVLLRNRLARAQEEERARIARDLHDDTGQRLALLSIDLEQLKQVSTQLKSSLTGQLEALVKAASEITSDVHNVSRRLHPSQVELLGLPAALSNFCRDFAARNGMDINFVNSCPRQKPPQDAALCLFRVAQEAIRNVQKHSGTEGAMVQLDEVAGSMRLRVSDQGAGFNPESADFVHGLGLLSMQERLHSLGGELFIHSRPGGGTCIEACIPLAAAVSSEQ
jgi:two-component system, NarL family, sensor kinase